MRGDLAFAPAVVAGLLVRISWTTRRVVLARQGRAGFPAV